MRASADKNDPGFTPKAHLYEVVFDGAVCNGKAGGRGPAITADEETGEVTFAVTEAARDGDRPGSYRVKFDHKAGRVVTETVTGRVQILMKETVNV